MALREVDTELTVEEHQIIRTLTVGGYGPAGGMRGFHDALDAILPRVAFALGDIRDPRHSRGRPSALANHRKRQARCKLFRAVALAATEALTKEPAKDRNERRKEQRALRAVIRTQRKVGNDHDVAASVAKAESHASAQRQLDARRRSDSKSVLDALALNLRMLIERYTRLRGEARQTKIAAIMAALNLASPDPSAVRQRFRRIPANMKAAAAVARSHKTKPRK